MDVVLIIVTLLMIASILVIVNKKFYVPISFALIGFIALLAMTIATGNSVLKEGTTGSAYLDIFEVMANAVTTSLGTTGLVIMTVMGYVGYMNHIKASELFGLIAAKPLRKLKTPNIAIVLTFILAIIVKLAIPSSSSEVTLLIATIYPVLLAVGISKQTAAATLMLSMAYVWGPSNTLAYTAFNAAGLTDLSIPLYFATKEIIPILVSVCIGAAVFIPVNRYFDKKENVLIDRKNLPEIQNPKTLGIPLFYAVFPLLPVIFVIIFSDLVVQSVTISVVAANFLSLIAVIIIELIRKRNLSEVINSTKTFFESMGQAFTNVVSILIGINIFAAGLNAVGGLALLANMFTGAGGTAIGIALIGCLAAFALVAIGGSISGILPLFSTIFAQFATSQPELINMVRMLIFSGGLGSAINPISPTAMIISGSSDVPITTIIKRTLIPTLASLGAILIVCILVP